jgi:superfamily II DNA helicase RecQ
MQFRFFRIKQDDIETSQEELNKFLRSCKVLAVHKDFDHSAGVWCYSVEYLDDQALLSKSNGKIDYREKLTKEEFAKFRVLRECRKTLSAEDGMPPYVVFLDEHLAAFSKIDLVSLDQMKTVKGIGDQKIQKYGERFITLWCVKKADVEKYLSESDEKGR